MNMTTFKQFLESEQLVLDSINDKGRFKAVFITGIPGAGKSYTAKSLSGSIAPAMVNIDRPTEFIVKKDKVKSTGDNWDEIFNDRATRMTLEALYHQINGIRPLFIDGTSNDGDAIMHRADLLERIGYDVGMIFIDTPVEVAKRRAAAREQTTGRAVDVEYIDKVYAASLENRPTFEARFDFFKVYSNGIDNMDNSTMNTLFKKTEGFFTEPLKNTTGIKAIQAMEEAKASYLVPAVYTEERLKSMVQTWYSK